MTHTVAEVCQLRIRFSKDIGVNNDYFRTDPAFYFRRWSMDGSSIDCCEWWRGDAHELWYRAKSRKVCHRVLRDKGDLSLPRSDKRNFLQNIVILEEEFAVWSQSIRWSCVCVFNGQLAKEHFSTVLGIRSPTTIDYMVWFTGVLMLWCGKSRQKLQTQ